MSANDSRPNPATNFGETSQAGRLGDPGQHLTEDQIDHKLIGDLGPPGSIHLADCEFCVDRVAEAAAPIAAFQSVTLAWGERRSATLPLHQTIAKSAKFHPRLAWVAGVVIAAAVGATIPVISHQERPAVVQTHESSQTAIADSSSRAGDQVLRDNQMLQAIDRELDASVASPESLGLTPVSSTGPKPGHPSPIED